MPSSSEQPTSEALPAGEPPAPVWWQSWPVRDNTAMSVVVVSGLAAAGLVVYGLTEMAMMSVLAAAALAAAMWRFFLPVTFELNDEGVEQRFLGRHRHIPWQAVDGYELSSGGVFLLPRQDGSPMAYFRSLYVPWTSHREEVLAQIRYHLDRPGKT